MNTDTTKPAAINTRRYEQIYAGAIAFFVTIVLLTNTVGVKLFEVFGRTLPHGLQRKYLGI